MSLIVEVKIEGESKETRGGGANFTSRPTTRLFTPPFVGQRPVESALDHRIHERETKKKDTKKGRFFCETLAKLAKDKTERYVGAKG